MRLSSKFSKPFSPRKENLLAIQLQPSKVNDNLEPSTVIFSSLLLMPEVHL